MDKVTLLAEALMFGPFGAERAAEVGIDANLWDEVWASCIDEAEALLEAEDAGARQMFDDIDNGVHGAPFGSCCAACGWGQCELS